MAREMRQASREGFIATRLAYEASNPIGCLIGTTQRPIHTLVVFYQVQLGSGHIRSDHMLTSTIIEREHVIRSLNMLRGQLSRLDTSNVLKETARACQDGVLVLSHLNFKSYSQTDRQAGKLEWNGMEISTTPF